MSGGSSTNNSWTILTPEETVTETLKPLEQGTEQHEETLTSAAGSGDNQPTNGEESAEGPPAESHVESHLAPEEEKTAELSRDTSTEQPALLPTSAPESPVPSTLEVSSSFVPDSDALSQSEGLPEGPEQTSPDPDSFSESYTHISPSPEEPSASLLSTETLGGGEFTQDEELTQEETAYPLNGEELQQDEETDLLSRTPDIGKQAAPDPTIDSEVAEDSTEKTGGEGEPEVRRRRSLLAALERIGRREEEEEGEEFQLPPREEDSGFSVNKCILGAVILLGLGTIFISDSDYATRELKDAELPGKQEWLNPAVPPSPVEADNTELLNNLAEGDQQISVLRAQLQAQEEELKVAKGAAAEGAKERLRWEEVAEENSRLKKEMASLPVLQKENERMKRELESVAALQKELETLRASMTELKLSSANAASMSPPSGQTEDSTQDTDGSTERHLRKPWDDQREKKRQMGNDENYMGETEKSGQKEDAKKDVSTEGEWKKEKYEYAKSDKKKDKNKWLNEEKKHLKEKDGKKDKPSRGDEGKSWKDREEKKEWKDKNGRKEWKEEEKDWKKGKHEKLKEGKQWKGKEEKDWKVGKDHKEKYKDKEEWKGEKDWKKGKESGKEKWEKKGWKEKGEKKEWKKDNDWKSKNSKEWKGKGERKQWEESKNHGKAWKGKEEQKEWKEKEWKSKNRKDERKQWEKKEEKWKREGQRESGDWKKERKSQKQKDEHRFKIDPKEEHLWGNRKPPHSHRPPSLEQHEYWLQQRERLQHDLKPSQHCSSLESCAHAEGLLPVPLSEFEAVLQAYLTKAEEAGVDEPKREELKKLASEFFKDGVFVHDQMSFQDFVEDIGDILEDMVEDDDDEDGEDSAIEEEMEAFEKDVLKKFAAPGAAARVERSKGEWRKESGQGRG